MLKNIFRKLPKQVVGAILMMMDLKVVDLHQKVLAV
jgi:hypothetical protein